jgi:TonB-linked SusC/RagA family outer membrane protein
MENLKTYVDFDRQLKKWLFKMKLTLTIFLFCLTGAFASTYSQVTRLDITMKNGNMVELIKQIESKSEFFFYYQKQELGELDNLTVKAKNATVMEILDKVLKGTPFDYSIIDRYIVVRKVGDDFGNDVLATAKENVAAQQRAVSGKVIDESGQPLPGVTILIKGTSQGTVTDLDGNYTLTNIPTDATLVFSFVGMRTQEVVVGNQTSINVIMEEESIGLDEVVAIGYGTVKRENLTGAVSTASAERLENRPIASTGHGLQGVIPNLNVSIRSGDPTSRADYNIRGFESINGGSPLILVDGVPMDLDLINPNDIESINVLKDASSAAVYGAKAAFGVILVQTKSGRQGLNVTFSTEQSLSKPIFHMDLYENSYEYAQVRQKLYEDVGSSWINEERMQLLKNYYENPTKENEWTVVDGQLYFNGDNDFVNYMLTDFAPQQKYDMTVSGATDKSSYYVSFGYLNKKGYLKNKDANLNYNRFNILMKAEFKLTDWLSLDPKIALNSEFNDEPHYYVGDRALNTIVRLTPNTPVKFPDLPYYLEPGDREDWEQYIGMYFTGARNAPFAHLGGRDLNDSYDLWLTQGATLNPFKGFRLRSDFSHRIFYRMRENQQTEVPMVNTNLLDFRVQYAQSVPTYIQNQSDYNRYYVFNTYGEYEYDESADHYFKVMAGFNQEWGRNQNIQARANELATSSVLDLSATTGAQQTDGGKSHVSLRGAFYRLNYRFRDKYLLETNGRYDLTSRFPKESRMGFFPSFSAAWRISNEGFMSNTSGWLDNLMIRASYGTLGNQLLGSNYYPYISTMGMGLRPHIFDSDYIPYVSPYGLISSELTWETVSTKNIGLDLYLLDQRLEFTFDTYIRETKDMLMNQTFPVILGTSAPDANAANLETRGWEMSVTLRDRINQNWNYRINLALSDNQAEITKYENPTGSLGDYYVGMKIGEIWGYEAAMINKAQTSMKICNL